jgi:hypothetical protein
MMFLWSYGFVFLAAFFNACMDICEDEPHFNKSIFKNLDKTFFCKSISWQYAKTILGYRLDFWHLCKSVMISCLVGAIVIFRIHHEWWVHFISFGVIWNVTFSLFYHKLLRTK